MLFYAQGPASISRLTIAHIEETDGTVRICLGDIALTLPGPVAELALEQASARRSHAVLAQTDSSWLFPGGQPGRPISAWAMGERLRKLGIRLAETRSTALFQLATELPAAILARALGIHITVAGKWQRAAVGNWGAYAADISRRPKNPGAHMPHHAEQSANQPEISQERVAEAQEIINRITRWAANRQDIVGLLLVGSFARDAARPDSDIDIVLLTTDQAQYFNSAWANELALGELIRTQSWGPITERRYAAASGLEVEIGISSPEWAQTDTVDPGTRRVVTDGARPLHDPAGVLAALIQTCRS
ncbi:nucleotidyltransferase domain-containing protein [Streptomyces prasinus]|uniref:nucleotidyltransferase domain-containing protein n=1 Tax=Streptomyces prasinus TaxID=67345 RepID=UPI002F3F7963